MHPHNSGVCRKCRQRPTARRRRWCQACIDALALVAGKQPERESGEPRTCVDCGQRHEAEWFRNFTETHVRYRKTCAWCACLVYPESLSPYQRALVEVEAESGLPHTIWMRQNQSVWNRRHYDLMAAYAGVNRLSVLTPAETLYRFVRNP